MLFIHQSCLRVRGRLSQLLGKCKESKVLTLSLSLVFCFGFCSCFNIHVNKLRRRSQILRDQAAYILSRNDTYV